LCTYIKINKNSKIIFDKQKRRIKGDFFLKKALTLEKECHIKRLTGREVQVKKNLMSPVGKNPEGSYNKIVKKKKKEDM